MAQLKILWVEVRNLWIINLWLFKALHSISLNLHGLPLTWKTTSESNNGRLGKVFYWSLVEEMNSVEGESE